MEKKGAAKRESSAQQPDFVEECEIFHHFTVEQRLTQSRYDLQANYRFPCAIFTASGSRRRRNIEMTPNRGPGARIMKA